MTLILEEASLSSLMMTTERFTAMGVEQHDKQPRTTQNTERRRGPNWPFVWSLAPLGPGDTCVVPSPFRPGRSVAPSGVWEPV